MERSRISSEAVAPNSGHTSAMDSAHRRSSNDLERETFGSAGLVRFGDPNLKAEQSISVDGGFDQRFANDSVSFGATYFYTRDSTRCRFHQFCDWIR